MAAPFPPPSSTVPGAVPSRAAPRAAPFALAGQRPLPEKKVPEAVTREGIGELSKDVSNLSRRIMVLEDRYANVRKKMQLVENSLLRLSKDITKDVRALSSTTTDYRREFIDLRDKVRLIVKELQDCAKSDEVRTLTTYLELWEPLHFVTRSELDRELRHLNSASPPSPLSSSLPSSFPSSFPSSSLSKTSTIKQQATTPT